MKKLTTILISLLLTSSVALAKTKTSRSMETGFGSPKECRLMVYWVDKIASELKDVKVNAKCRGTVMEHQWKVNYVFTPNQKFKQKIGFAPVGGYDVGITCSKIASFFGKMSDLEFSVDTRCLRDKRISRVRLEYLVYKKYFGDDIYLSGKISLKK